MFLKAFDAGFAAEENLFTVIVSKVAFLNRLTLHHRAQGVFDSLCV